MSDIRPFQAIRPKQEFAERIAALPYDVYDTEEARQIVSANSISFLARDRPEVNFEEGHDIYGKDVVIFDDIADTAGTLCKAAEVMKEGGAKSVRAVVTHGVLSGIARERIEESALEELICTDSLPVEAGCCTKLHLESLAAPIANTIRAIQNHTSISETNIR